MGRTSLGSRRRPHKDICRSGKLSLENPEQFDLLTYTEFCIILIAKDPIDEIFTFPTDLLFPE